MQAIRCSSLRFPLSRCKVAAVCAEGIVSTAGVMMTIGKTAADAVALARPLSSLAAFEAGWAECHSKWEARWQAAFDDTDPFFTGSVPTLVRIETIPDHQMCGIRLAQGVGGCLRLQDLGGAGEAGGAAAGVSRVFYASVLSIVSQMRTNLPLMYEKVWPTSQVSTFVSSAVQLLELIALRKTPALPFTVYCPLYVSPVQCLPCSACLTRKAPRHRATARR